MSTLEQAANDMLAALHVPATARASCSADAGDCLCDCGFHSAVANLRAALAATNNHQEQTPIMPKEVNIMTLSANAIRLAIQYIAIVEQYEDPAAYRESGYTPTEMELRRKRAHDTLLAELKKCHVDISDRASTTELAHRCSVWLNTN